MKQIGEKVEVGNKVYTISGYHKRSYILTDDSGRQYKVGPEKLNRLESGEPKMPTKYFERHISYSKIFGKVLEMPNKNNVQEWMDLVEGELSPENLTCDGELSGSQVAAKSRELRAAMLYLTKIKES